MLLLDFCLSSRYNRKKPFKMPCTLAAYHIRRKEQYMNNEEKILEMLSGLTVTIGKHGELLT